MSASVTLPVAFLAGLAAFVSPCFLPLVPAMLTSLAADASGSRSRRAGVAHALTFVVAFSLVFALTWLGVGAAAGALARYHTLIRVIAGGLVVVMGFQISGLLRIPGLERTLKARVKPRGGHARPFLLGLAFAAGWTPCIGPILAAIIAMAASAGSLARGAVLMAAFCAGLGIPLILLAAGIGTSGRVATWFKVHHRPVSIATGIVLVVTGFAMMTNWIAGLSHYIPAFASGVN